VITEEAQIGLLLAFIGGPTRRTILASHEEWLRALKMLAERANKTANAGREFHPLSL